MFRREDNMAKVSVFLVDGFETVEALAVVDLLRRAKINVETISLMDSKEVVSAQKIKVAADIMLWEAEFADSDMLFVPGGGGYKLINADEKAKNIIRSFYEKDKYIAAICAAPSIFGQMELLKGKKAVCFPGFEDKLIGAEYTDSKVVVDGKIITSKGMGTSIDLGLEIIGILVSEEEKINIGKSIQYLP